MPGLPAIGTLTYNGVTFDGASEVSVSIELVKDDAERTVIYQRHTITVRGVVADGANSTDAAIEDIRRRLGEPAREIKLVNRGFGVDFTVGPDAATKDIKFGPMPQIIMWAPIGSNRAAEIEWQCVVCIPVCDSIGATRTTGILALNYDMAFRVDSQGDTTRTISGYIEVAISRNGRAISDTADAHFSKFVASPIAGFEREVERTVSKDRSRVDFRIIDKQIPSRNPYPPYVTAINGKHRVRWSRGKSGGTLRNSITLEITPMAGINPALAWAIFRDLVFIRTSYARGNGFGVLLDDLEIEEDIFGRPCSLSCSYRVLSTLVNIMNSTGIWQPVGTNWGTWRTSLAAVSGYRGTAGLSASADVIVDLCGGEQVQSESQLPTIPGYPAAALPSLSNTTPPANSSYLEFFNSISPLVNNPTVQQSMMQSPLPESPPSPGEVTNDESESSSMKFQPTVGLEDLLQQGGQPSYQVRMLGWAERAGHPIPRPILKTFGDATLVEVDAEYTMAPSGNSLGVPVYKAAWNILYAANKSPGFTLPVTMNNPKEGMRDDGTIVTPDPAF